MNAVEVLDCSPEITETWVTLRLADAGGAYTSVRLSGDSALTRAGRPLARHGDVWSVGFDRPDLGRIEYQFIAERTLEAGGGTAWLTDPCNPPTVETAFGPKSVLELPGYTPPPWLAAEGVDGRYDRFELPAASGELGEPLPLAVWSPAASADEDPLPLLLVHDGPEYDDLTRLSHYAAVQIRQGVLPPHRLALLRPVQRNEWYAASPAYLRTETGALLDLLRGRYAVSGPVAVMGASLGGLTALLAGLHDAGSGIGAVFSQSGSFFNPAHDGQESGFGPFARISAAVADVLQDAAYGGLGEHVPTAGAGTGVGSRTRPLLRIAMTCGALEENAANNRDIAAALRRAGHPVTLREIRDLHNYTAWRDALDPTLTSLLQDCWDAPG